MPSVGEVYDRGIETGTAYRVEGVGQSTGTLYLRLLVAENPSPQMFEWPGHRWMVLVAREGLELRP